MKLILALLIFLQFSSIGQVNHVQEANVIEQNGVSLIDCNPLEVDGKVRISGTTEKSLIKVMIEKDNQYKWVKVPLDNGKFDKEIWLLFGKGIYTISIMVNEEGRLYSYGPQIFVDNTLEVNQFIVPAEGVESNAQEIVKKAREIVEGKCTDMEKARAIYKWVIDNIEYDYGKYFKQLRDDYSSEYGALNTFKTGKGICCDYATLVAALGRAIGLKVKVVNGTAGKELHAWNEIYISESKKWIILDTTAGDLYKRNYFNKADLCLIYKKIAEY